MRAVLVAALLLLPGCLTSGDGPDAELAWTPIPLHVGDVWHEEGRFGARDYVVEPASVVPYFTGDAEVFALRAQGRLLYYEARSGAFLAINAIAPQSNFWNGSRGGWIGFGVQDPTAYIYNSLTLASQAWKEPTAIRLAQVPAVVRPEGHALHLDLQGRLGEFAAQDILSFSIDAIEDGWTFSYTEREFMRFTRVFAGTGPQVSVDARAPFAPYGAAVPFPPSREVFAEVQTPPGWTFPQSQALAEAARSPEWPFRDGYVVRFAKYYEGIGGPLGARFPPAFRNETWEFQVQQPSSSSGSSFSVVRTTTFGMNPTFSASGFSPAEFPVACTDFPQPISDPTVWTHQLQTAGFEVHWISVSLERRAAHEPPGTFPPLEHDGLRIPMECDWFVEFKGYPPRPSDPLDDSPIPVVLGSGFLASDGLDIGVG